MDLRVDNEASHMNIQFSHQLGKHINKHSLTDISLCEDEACLDPEDLKDQDKNFSKKLFRYFDTKLF